MPKLHWNIGTCGAGKTAMLLMAAHQYTSKGKSVFIIKPTADKRSERLVYSRIKILSRQCDMFLSPEDTLRTSDIPAGTSCIFVDEAQFFPPEQIVQLAKIAQTYPVICYGIRTDFLKQPFPAAVTLFAHAHEINFIRSVCGWNHCERLAMFNMRLTSDGKPSFSGESVETGNHYLGVCDQCYDGCYDAWMSRD